MFLNPRSHARSQQDASHQHRPQPDTKHVLVEDGLCRSTDRRQRQQQDEEFVARLGLVDAAEYDLRQVELRETDER